MTRNIFFYTLLFCTIPFLSFAQILQNNQDTTFFKRAYIQLVCPPIYSSSTIRIEIQIDEVSIADAQSKENFDFTRNPMYAFSLNILNNPTKKAILSKGLLHVTEIVDTNYIKTFGYQNQWCKYILTFQFSDGSRVEFVQNYIVSYTNPWNQKISSLEDVLDKDFDSISDDED